MIAVASAAVCCSPDGLRADDKTKAPQKASNSRMPPPAEPAVTSPITGTQASFRDLIIIIRSKNNEFFELCDLSNSKFEFCYFIQKRKT